VKVSKFTIFNVPLLIPILSRFSRFSGALLGWSIEGEFPNYPKMMLAAAPHTSNWDFLMFLYAILSKRVQPNVMGKHTLFWWPLSAIMRFLGVVPIDRTQKGGVVEQGIKYFNSVDKTIILVSTRGNSLLSQRVEIRFLSYCLGSESAAYFM
jgi:1-acyl-sn-glycerol-3-phosphate acyltransferase